MTATPRSHPLTFPSLLRFGTLLSALILTLLALRHEPLALSTACAVLASAVLLLVVRSAPVVRTREGTLTFTAPVVFALLLWLGAPAAASGALLACFLLSRMGVKTGEARRAMRFQGAQLALAVWAGNALWMHAHSALLPASAPIHLFAMACGSASVFTLAYGLLALGEKPARLRSLWRSASYRTSFRTLALVYLLGMLPPVLLTLLDGQRSLLFGLPLLALLLLCAQIARLAQEAQSLRGQLQTTQAMGRASIADPDNLDSTALLQRFLTLAQDLVAADQALVWLMDTETGEFAPAAGLPDTGVFAGCKVLFGEGMIGHTAARMRPRRIANARQDPHRLPDEPVPGAWLLYPIIAHERLLGVAQWVRPVSNPFTAEDVARLDALMPHCGVALESIRIREAMQNLAATDGLTSLWNHRKMQELLRSELSRASRYHRALSVLMLDVDSFKSFNDTYGHPRGDELLRQMAAILYSSLRTHDSVGRYGGEEFMVILPETAKDDACRLAERIRTAVEERAFVFIEGEAIHRTVSVGVASYPEDALNAVALVQCADEALYRAKRAGKNCVLWA